MSPKKDYEKNFLGQSRKLAETCLSKAQALEKFKAGARTIRLGDVR
jgi:hypothetical protein